MRILFLIGSVILLKTCDTRVPIRQAATAPPAAPAPDDPLRSLALKVFEGVNRERSLHRLPKLKWSDALAEQARLESTNMMERGFFSHTDPVRGPLAERLNAAGIRWSRCSENIFREQGMDDPAESAVEGWMKSPPHREGLLDSLVTETGVGIAVSPDTEYFITQIFLHPPK
ncbi:MAG TPA: CAP domain-containing protein [Bryobacteraceae bacterium]|nr:CAP domain-containing protein [Bryobacteraceae bacterium]